MAPACKVHTDCQEVLGLGLRVERDSPDYVVMLKGVQGFSTVSVPDLANRGSILGTASVKQGTHAVKSALPVTARDVSRESLVDHTAPLCPGLAVSPILPHDVTLTQESPNPVSQPATEHRVSILASGYEQISTIVKSTSMEIS